MKKFFGLILTLALLLSVGVPTAYACAGRHHGWQTACRFVDANEDGVCDNCRGDCRKAAVDQNNDGICDHCGEDCDGHWIDMDGDGVCDHCGETCHRQDADGDGVCDNHGQVCGQNFVDANQNGICDNRAANACPRQQVTEGHHGMGHGCGRK